MSRPRINIGTWGDFYFEPVPGGVCARSYYRDWDGSRRLVQASGPTQTAAERALKLKLSQRSDVRPTDTVLTPDSTFQQLAEYWLADIELEDRLAPATRQGYADNLRLLVLPTFKCLTLREIGVARCDTLIKQLARQSYNRARQAKVVLRLSFALAVRHEVIPRNPMDGVARLHKPTHDPDAFTAEEVTAIRTAVQLWQSGVVKFGPKPDGQLAEIIEVMLGTSARIGEVLAIRRRDVNINGERPSVRIRRDRARGHRSRDLREDGHAPASRRSGCRRTVGVPRRRPHLACRRISLLGRRAKRLRSC